MAGARKRTAKKASMTCTDQGLWSAFAGTRPGGLTGTYSAISRASTLQSDHTPLPRLVSAECASSRRYTKVCNPRLVPLTAANHPQAPPELRAALAVITRHADDYAARARLPRAA